MESIQPVAASERDLAPSAPGSTERRFRRGRSRDACDGRVGGGQLRSARSAPANGGRPGQAERVRFGLSEGSPGRYTYAVGLLIPREDAFDERRTLAVFEAGAAEISVALPQDLPRIADWPRSRLDGDHYQHRVALAVAGGGYELLPHFCADDGRRHEPPGHHSWGDSGHESDDLAYSLLCASYGGRFQPGWRVPDPPVPALLFPGLFEVFAGLPRGHSWRVQWDSLRAVATERHGG